MFSETHSGEESFGVLPYCSKFVAHKNRVCFLLEIKAILKDIVEIQ